MGLSDAIKDAVGAAFSAIADLATQMTYVSIAPGGYVPSAGSTFSARTEYVTTGIIVDYKDKELDGDRIRRGDRKVLLEQSKLSPIPNLGDQIEVESSVYNILQIEQDPVGATWTFQVRVNE